MSRPRGPLWMLTLHCREASELVSDELEAPLSRLEALALRGHLLVCSSCRRFRRQIRLIREAARLRARSAEASSGPDGRLSDEARRRIVRALDEADPDRA